MEHLKKLINNKNIWFKDPNDCLYLTKFSSSNLNVFFVNNKWYVITDDRYIDSAKKMIKNMKILNMKDSPFQNIIFPEIKKSKKNLSVDENNFSYVEYKGFTEKYSDLTLEHIDLKSLRLIKSDDEIKEISVACKITDDIFEKLVKEIKPGISEKDVEKKLMRLIFSSDADDISFWPIVAAGVNSAIPHWKASNYILKSDDIITIDFGVKYNNYVSDMTRTFSVKDKMSKEKEKVCGIVLEALERAIAFTKVGVKVSEIDDLVRDYFEENNYEEFFTHALGHGIGVEVHEGPVIFGDSDVILEENMVITIEPGIYLSNKFGCRIEQDIVVKKNKSIELNNASKSLYFN